MDEIAVGKRIVGQGATLRGDFLFCDFRLFVHMVGAKRLFESDTTKRLHAVDSLCYMEYDAHGHSSAVRVAAV